MRPVHQTTFGDRHGNCFAACLASVLEVPLEAVPNFCVEYPDRWFEEANRFVAASGLALLMLMDGPGTREALALVGCFAVVGGRSPRGDYGHCVVYRGLEMAHDPHPSGHGIAGEPQDWTVFVAVDPPRAGARPVDREAGP